MTTRGRCSIDWATTQPGDVVILDAYVRLESVVRDADFSTGDKMQYCLCIACLKSETVTGLTTLKVYVLTPYGIGYKRINLGGDNKDSPPKTYRTWV